MSVKIFLTIVAIIALLFGIGDILFPAQVGAFYGFEINSSTVLVARFMGVGLLAWGLILWLLRDVQDACVQRATLIAAGVANAAGVVISTMGATSGVMNALGWTLVLIFVFEWLGSVYFLWGGSRRLAGA